MRSEDKRQALGEVTRRTVAHVLERSAKSGAPLDEVIAESIYLERRRLKEERDNRTRRADEAFWASIHESLRKSSGAKHQDVLTQIVDRYGSEIAGEFDERVYQAVTRGGPPALSLLLNAVSPKRILTSPKELPKLDDAIVIQGETEHLRRLHELGTVILVPTHVSNMDSIVVGYALYRMGLPPFIYGAGLNLFSNPLMGFFMHHLGAYTVDRKKADPLYKEALKTYASVTLEFGYDNIFFPGGTRSRSGALEAHLKLGLLGAGTSAYIQNLKRSTSTPRVFIVPATLSFQLVLEADTLIDDFLKEAGKSRYIITDDEFSQPRRIFEFITQLFALDSKIYFTVSRGMDPFGNLVDDHGESLDPCGRQVDPSRYVLVDGRPEADGERDTEYTRELGQRVVDAFKRDNVIQSTNVLARALFAAMRQQSPKIDVLRLVRAGGDTDKFTLARVYAETDRLLGELRSLCRQKELRLDSITTTGSVEDVVSDGLKHFAIYHRVPAAIRKGDAVILNDRQLLFYYQNRLEGYGVSPEPQLPPALSRDHRSIGGRR